jgi:hypothetical protein
MPDTNRLRASPEQIKAVARQTKRSVNSIRRWVRQGCNLNSAASIKQFSQGNKLRQHPNTIRKSKGDAPGDVPAEPAPDLNQIELGPIGKRGRLPHLNGSKRLKSDHTPA